MMTPATVSTPSQPVPRRRFRATDVAENLDMLIIGQICLGVTFSGYSKLLDAVFSEQSGSLGRLLCALDGAQTSAIRADAHSFKGETSVLGLKALAQQAFHCEEQGASFTPADCQQAAAKLRECWDTTQALCRRMGLVAAAQPNA